MSAISSTNISTSHILTINERAYHQSNLLGDWKGTTKQNQAVEFKVISINGNSAQVEYTQNGRIQRGTAIVDQNAITFGNVTIATRDGQQAAFVDQPGGAVSQTTILSKTADTDVSPLQGSWTGANDKHKASFQVISINGRDAQVRYNIDGTSGQGVGDVFGNAVLLGKIQFSNINGLDGNVTFQSGHQTISLAVQKFTPQTV
jgi:ribosomal protein S8E